jgi:hypothetical protein
VTTVDTNPLFNTKHEKLRIDAVLRHLGSGADLRDLPGSASEKVALVKTANQRGLITWHKGRSRYELTSAGWCELAPSRRFGMGSMMMGTTVGASLGAAVLAVFWFTAGAAHRPTPARSVVAAQVAKPPAPAAPTQSSAVAPTPVATPPAAMPVEPEPTVAQEPTPEQRAEAAAKARHAAAVARKQAAAAKREKARQRAAARRKREDAARDWAANGARGRQADGNGRGYYGNYGGQNPWNAYR